METYQVPHYFPVLSSATISISPTFSNECQEHRMYTSFYRRIAQEPNTRTYSLASSHVHFEPIQIREDAFAYT